MCGILGIISKDQNKSIDISAVNKLMYNRGPDQQGDYKVKNKNFEVNLFSSRLKIQDLNDRSNQPYKFKNLVLIFNGEIYNYREIRKELEFKGRKFLTTSDTEVLIQSYDEWGLDCIKKLNGMWGFCIYDKLNEKIILSRDFFGEKPLFFSFKNNEFIFGSEINYLFFFNKNLNKINDYKIGDYLINGYKSLFKNNETYFEDINFVEPGSIIELNLKNFSLRKNKINPFLKVTVSKNHDNNYKLAKEIFLSEYEKRLRSDVPISFCLSGGIDSSALVSIAKKEFNLNPYCFSIISEDLRYNEFENINFLKKKLDLNVKFIKIPKLSLENFVENCKKLINYRCSPISTISYYIHSYISKACSDKNFKVIMSGTGADEIFTGYYDHTLFYLNEIKDDNKYKDELTLWKKFTQPKIRNPILDLKNFQTNPYLRDHLYNDIKSMNKIFNIKKYNKFSEINYDRNNLKNRMKNELFHESVPVILFEDDSNSMMHSIENRSPFLSINLVNFINSLNVELYMDKGYTKNILRKILQEYLPDKVRLDRKKVGFNASILDVVDINYENFSSLIKKNYFMRKNLNMDKFLFLKNRKRNISNSESKLLFNIINTCIFYDTFS